MYQYILKNHKFGLVVWIASVIIIAIVDVVYEVRPEFSTIATILLAPLKTTLFVVPWLFWVRFRMKNGVASKGK